MNPARVLLAAALAVPCLAACTAPPAPAEEQTTYTCCTAEDVDTPYHPGQTMSLTWIVKQPDGPGTTSPSVELTARLTGPYANGASGAVKGDATGAPSGLATYAADPLRPSGGPDEEPVSRIHIPSDAEPGFYHLHFSVSQGDSTTTGDTQVRVVAKS